jgi:hypothetical protein
LILAAAALAAIGSAPGAHAQGSIELDNTPLTIPGGISLYGPNNYYPGVFGLEVWELNGSIVPAGINSVAPYVAYANVQSAGFRRVATFADQITWGPGSFRLGEVDMPNVTPAGANVVLALGAWDSAAPTLSDALTGWFNGKVAVGFIAFVNPTANYTAFPTPAPPPLSGWTSDLIMVYPQIVPEPSAFALAGVGAAVWLLLRRHRNPRQRGHASIVAASRQSAADPP